MRIEVRAVLRGKATIDWNKAFDTVMERYERFVSVGKSDVGLSESSSRTPDT